MDDPIKLPVAARYDPSSGTWWLADADGRRVPQTKEQVDYLVALLNSSTASP